MRNQILGYARPRHSARTGSKEGFVPEPRERRIKAQHSRTASEPERPRMMSQSGGHSCSLHVGRNARVGMAAKKEGLPTGRPASESTTAKQPSLSFRIWAEPSYQRTPTSPTTYLDTTKTNEKVCTVKPCPNPREERLTPSRVIESSKSSVYVGSACEGNTSGLHKLLAVSRVETWATRLSWPIFGEGHHGKGHNHYLKRRARILKSVICLQRDVTAATVYWSMSYAQFSRDIQTRIQYDSGCRYPERGV
jgi:hypothetical protein